jgi:hypothetical protein
VLLSLTLHSVPSLRTQWAELTGPLWAGGLAFFKSPNRRACVGPHVTTTGAGEGTSAHWMNTVEQGSPPPKARQKLFAQADHRKANTAKNSW